MSSRAPPDLATVGAALLRVRGEPERIAVLVEPCGAGGAAALAAEVGVARVFAHPPAPPIWQPPALACVLGAEDCDVVAARPSSWPAGLLPAPYKQRRIDTVYDRRLLGLLAFARPQAAASALHGAAACLARCRPSVLLDLTGLAPAEAAAYRDATLRGLSGYRWEHTGGIACAQPQGMAWPEVIDAPAARLLQTPFDAALACAGLHPPEPGAPLGGRWTGAAPGVWFAVPRPAAGQWTLVLSVADWGESAGAFAASLDQAPPLAGRAGPGSAGTGSLRFGPFAVPARAGGVLQVALFGPRPTRDLRRGPRKLGIRIAHATLRAAR